MTSKRQIEANRRNARNSKGPKTKKGKAVSRFNAVRHGLTAEEIVIPGEVEQDFRQLHQRLITELDPKGVLETQIVERIAVAFWRLRRSSRIEAGILARQFLMIVWRQTRDELKDCERRPIINPVDEDFLDEIPTVEIPAVEIVDPERHARANAKLEEVDLHLQEDLPALGSAFIEDARETDALSKLSRYETAIERSLYRALHELQRLQAARKGGVAAPIAVDLTIDSGESVGEG